MRFTPIFPRDTLGLIVVAMAALAAPQASFGQVLRDAEAEVSTRSWNVEASDLRGEIESISQRLDRMDAGDQHRDGCGGCCRDQGCCCCCPDPCCRSQGFMYGADLVFLKPHNANGTGLPGVFANQLAPVDNGGFTGPVPIAAGFDDGHVDPEFEASPRIWLGYSRCDGLGWRLRYWEFDHEFGEQLSADTVQELQLQAVIPFALDGNPLAGVDSVFHGWDTWIFDAEVMKSAQLGCGIDATFSVGFRHVEFEESAGTSGNGVLLATRHHFNGIGATTAMELRAPVTCNLGLYLNTRYSAVYGDEEYRTSGTLAFDASGLNPPPFSDELQQLQTNSVKFIWELQAGAEYIVPMCGGGYYYLRGGAELQYWDGFGADHSNNALAALESAALLNLPVNPTTVSPDGGLGFGGFVISAGIVR